MELSHPATPTKGDLQRPPRIWDFSIPMFPLGDSLFGGWRGVSLSPGSPGWAGGHSQAQAGRWGPLCGWRFPWGVASAGLGRTLGALPLSAKQSRISARALDSQLPPQSKPSPCSKPTCSVGHLPCSGCSVLLSLPGQFPGWA